MSGGTAISWTAPALPYLTSVNSSMPINAEEGSWVGALLPVGALFGGLPAGSVADRFGRKNTVLGLGIPFIVSWFMIFVGNSVWVLYSARFLVGLAVGGACATVPMYISEIAEDSVRGTLGSYFQILLVAGIVYTYIMGAICHYKILSVVCALVSIVFLAAFFKAPETPVYLLKKGKKAEAEVALVRLRGNRYDIYSELDNLQMELNKHGGSGASFSLMLFQQFAGINAVVFYTEKIFIDAGSTMNPAVATIIVGLAQLTASYGSAVLIERAGRKLLLLVSSAVMSLCLGVLGGYFHVKDSGTDVSNFGLVPLAAVVVYMLVFSAGFGPIPWLMTGEILPQAIKGPATGMAVALNWALAFVVTKSFQDLVSTFGSAVTFWIFGIVCVLGFIFVYILVLETKGKSIYEIQNELGGKKEPKVNINNNEIA
ncbi:hypothetical protein AAG570_009733 [Ranatra chinensis]|uniref:Major facilitator superfamily (MFS) profile domain-containing protein n=1 Tax=Ranatra chinensis TaxID=642074 RepID=A0ABD0ZB16_9HEMI